MQKPDVLEQGIRLVCGAVFGLFLGLYVTRPWWYHGATIPLVASGCVAMVGALLANRYGDEFWKNWLVFLLVLIAITFVASIIKFSTKG